MAIEVLKEFNGRKIPVLLLNERAEEKYQVWFGKPKLRVILDRKNDIVNFLAVVKDGSVWEELSEYDRERLTIKTVKGKMKLDLAPEVNVNKIPFEISQYQAEVILKNLNSIVTYIEKDDFEKGRYFNEKVQEEMDARNKRRNMFRRGNREW